MRKEVAGFVLDVDPSKGFLRVLSCRGRRMAVRLGGGRRIYRRSWRVPCGALAPGDWVNVRTR